jgi:hypothetical protein
MVAKKDDGNFAAEWYPGDVKNNYTIFAMYEDQDGNVVKSTVYNVNIIIPKIEANATLPANNEPYIKIWNADWNQRVLNVYVIAKDDYSKRFIREAVTAINDLSTILKQESGNPNAWEFKIFTTANYPNWIQTIVNPINIAVELKYEGDDCNPEGFSGVTYPHDMNPIQRILKQRYTIEVFTGCNTSAKTVDVHWTTTHEMHHALGLGHAWHELGDMMCSKEPVNGQMTFTCQGAKDNYNDGNAPTEFDIRAVRDAYGDDGFAPPNNKILIV